MAGLRVRLFAAALISCALLLRSCTGAPVNEKSTHARPVRQRYQPRTIPGHYIVLLKPDVTISEANRWLLPLVDESPGCSLRHTYDTSAASGRRDDDDAGAAADRGPVSRNFRGFAGEFSDAVLERIRLHPDVLAVEPDQQVSLSAVQPDPPWNLARISQRDLPPGRSFSYPDDAGAGVDVYVVDTGVNVDHEQFDGGRATFGEDFTGEGRHDANGHGTHIAGTIAGKTVGVAKKANIIAVKVLDSTGLGSWSNVIAGVNWVVNKVVKKRRKSIANISIGGPRVISVNRAIETAIAAGIHFTVAAGNNGMDACGFSPASANGVVSVGAVGVYDDVKPWSNYGPCLSLFAPGENILSANYVETNGLVTLSGTSMASPHAAGMMALALSKFWYAPHTLKDLLYNHTTAGRIQDILPESQTPNRILYVWSPNVRSKAPPPAVVRRSV